MKFLRESAIMKSNRFKERRSVVGSYSSFDRDMWRQTRLDPHEEQQFAVKMFNRNSLANASVSTMKDFIKGGEVRVKSLDEKSRKQAQQYMEDLDVDMWIDELIENAIKTGNGYLETDDKGGIVTKVHPITDSSRMYINCDEFGQPIKTKKLVTEDGVQKYVEVLNTDEFYIQRIDPQYKISNAKYYSLKYQYGSMFAQYQIYGIPIPKDNVIHVKFGIGDIGVYGRSVLASTIHDFETLEQIERSLAIIAKHKAVPRDIITYGNEQNPATDDELNDFIIYLESLQKDESAIINKPISRETLSYAGQDINLDYMIKHIKKKLTAGIAPEFALGGGEDNKQTSQLTLLSYILSIYSKRKLILKPIEDKILKPFCKNMGLEDCWLEFGELDFETKSEKTNRVGALWTQNVVTLNEIRHQLGFPILEAGNVFFSQWQQELLQNEPDDNNSNNGDSLKKYIGNDESEAGTKGSPGANTEQPNQNLPNNDSPNDVFSHRDAPNKKTVQKGGRLPYDANRPIKKTPRLMRRDSNSLNVKDEYSEMMNDIKMLEKTLIVTVDIEDDDEQKSDTIEHKQEIDFKTLIDRFAYIFDEPMTTELFYRKTELGHQFSFNTARNVMIICDFTDNDIIEYYQRDRQLSYEQQQEFIQVWLRQHTQKSVEVK